MIRSPLIRSRNPTKGYPAPAVPFDPGWLASPPADLAAKKRLTEFAACGKTDVSNGRKGPWSFRGICRLGGGNSNIFYFHPYLGKIPILTNIFQMG